MKTILSNRNLLLGLFLFAHLWTDGQTVELITREKGKSVTSIKISLCDKEGNVPIQPSDFRNSDWVYFLAEPAQGYSRPQFSEKEVKEEFPKIALWQSEPGKYLTPNIKPIIKDKKIQAIILEFPKSETRAHLPFVFGKDGQTSEELELNETYYDFYPAFKATHDEVNRLMQAGEWLEAYYKATAFVRQEEVRKQLSSISFSLKLTDELPLQALTNGMAAHQERINRAQEKFNEKPSLQLLEALEKETEELRRFIRLTEGYKSMGFKASASYAGMIQSREAELQNIMESARNQYYSSLFGLLKGQSYLDQRFSAFTEYIFQALLNNLDEKSQPLSEELSPGKKEKFRTMGWLDDLEALIQALEKRKAESPEYAWLPLDVTQHICTLKDKQPQPYCEFLSLAGKLNFDGESEQVLVRAMNSCADPEMLILLELWRDKSKAGKAGEAQLPVALIRQGMQMLKSNNLQAAAERFDAALRQAPDNALAWYLRARAHHLAGEHYAAEAKLSKALELDATAISPQLLYIDILIENSQNEQLSQIFSRPVSNGPNYLFSLAKAKWLMQQNKHADAIKVITTESELLAPGQTSHYFLLGDAYAALKQYDKAREAYLTTQKINPFDSELFEQKMRNLPRK
ncbi:MAG: tetratricopeptide repeat protein [Bacteroidetes bacterium]|nr:tetratricopeptide repeat protein [Bacteroidota bacterium]